MRLFFCTLLSAVFFACGDNPLAERVDELEQRLDEVEAAQEEDRLSLLARLDALAVTADNAEEIVAVRAKLNQTNVTRSEFTALKNRVAALESRIADWSRVVSPLQRSVYAVFHHLDIPDADAYEDAFYFSFVGTAFAVDSSTLVTNAHIIDALLDWDDFIDSLNRENETDILTYWIVLQNLTTSPNFGLGDQQNAFFCWEYSYHNQWDSDDVNSPDIGTLHIEEGSRLSQYVTLATRSAVYQLKAGTPIATLGFPGELQGFTDLGALYPIATFKNGTISALRPRFGDRSYTAPRDTYIVQHNLDLSGGTSGSPIFDSRGRVVAINNAGIDADFSGMGIDGDWPQISQAALGFGIRADKIHEALSAVGVAAKPMPHSDLSELASRLDGRDISSLNIGTTREDLAKWLERMQ